MSSLPKLAGPDLDASQEFVHPDVWQRQDYPDFSRLVIGAREREVPLILEFCREMEGPFGLLYVLLASRCGREHGRYQSPAPSSYEELELFLYTFQEFLEQDGRHHLWVMSTTGEGQFIFDNHNVVFAYGDLDRYEAGLRANRFTPGEVATPAPHAHNYHQQFDSSEDELMSYWQWRRYPLEPDDDP